MASSNDRSEQLSHLATELQRRYVGYMQQKEYLAYLGFALYLTAELEDVPSDAASSLAPPDDMVKLLQERRLQARRIGSVAVDLRISKPIDRLADPADR